MQVATRATATDDRRPSRLQGDVREHARALEAAGCGAVPVRRAAELDRVDGLVLPGGESTTMIKLARRSGCSTPLRERVRRAAGLRFVRRDDPARRPRRRDGRRGSRPSAASTSRCAATRSAARSTPSRRTSTSTASRAARCTPCSSGRPGCRRSGRPRRRSPRPRAAGHVIAVRQGPLLATSFHPGDDRRPAGARILLRHGGRETVTAGPSAPAGDWSSPRSSGGLRRGLVLVDRRRDVRPAATRRARVRTMARPVATQTPPPTAAASAAAVTRRPVRRRRHRRGGARPV